MQAIGEIRVPTLHLDGRFAASTVNLEKRTVDVVWTTGARVPKVRQRGWDLEEFDEELEVTPEAVRLERLNAGAPLFDNHWSQGSVLHTFGRVVRAWLANGEGWCTLKFRRSDDAEQALRDIQDEILGPVSFGYRVHRYVDITEDAKDARRTLRAVDWEPYEVSLVSMPADIGAGTRSAADELRTVPIYAQRAPEARGADMDEDQIPDAGSTPAATTTTTTTEQRSAPAPAAPPAPEPTSTRSDVDVDAVRREGAAAERERQTQIRSACAKAGLGGGDLEQRLLDNGVTIEDARAQIIDGLAADDEETSTRSAGGSRFEVGRTDLEKRDAGMVTALSHRASNGKIELDELGKEFRSYSLIDLGREFLEARGMSTRGMGRSAVAKQLQRRSQGLDVRAHSSSDFPQLLADVGQKTLRREYQELPKSYEPFVAETTNPDFKPSKRAQLSAAPPLQPKSESGEYKVGSMTDAGEDTKLVTHGVIVQLTREAMINDDLSAFTRVVPAQARRARFLESDLAYGVLTANANMADGNALFSADHSNTGGGAIGEAGLTTAYMAIAKQTGLSGEELALMPATIIVPVALRVKAEQYLSQNIVPTKASDSNVFRGWNLNIVSDPRLDPTSEVQWYMAAGKNQVDLVELVYLDDERGPQFEEDENFYTDALSYKVRLDVSAHAIDWRGLYRSSGA